MSRLDLDDVAGDESVRTMPIITVSGDLAQMSAAGWAAIVEANSSFKYFRHGSTLVRIEPGLRLGDAPHLRTLDVDELRHELARVATWQIVKVNKDGESTTRTCHPPIAVCRDMLAAPTFPVPPLVAVTPVPLVLADGTIQSEPGYHPSAHTYYAPAPGFIVPAIAPAPTDAEVAAAVSTVDEVFRDFPFVEKSDHANAWGALLTVFVRELIPDPTPLFMLTKPSPGTGATLLVQANSVLALGVEPEGKTLSDDDEEVRKAITATLRDAPRIVLLDNLKGFLNSGGLSSALTAHVWTDRVLGKNEDVHLPVRCVWFGTSNNATWTTELGRRITPIRLDSGVERPWTRAGFAHPDLLEWIAEHRALLVHACLTLVAAWLAKGRPSGQARHGSYARWSKIVGGILETAGVEGFLGNLDVVYEDADIERDELRQFLAKWWSKHESTRVSPTELLVVATEADVVLNGTDDTGKKKSLGWFLRKHKDRAVEIKPGVNVRIRRVAKDDPLWRLERRGFPGFPGFSPNPPDEKGVDESIHKMSQETNPENSETQPPQRCAQCGESPARPGFLWCESCFKKANRR